MPIIDTIILLFTSFWIIRGFLKGFVSELSSLLVWIVSILYFADNFTIITNTINAHITSKELLALISVLIIIIGTIIIAILLGFIMSKFVSLVGLAFYNKAFGLIFGFLKAMIFIMITLFYLNQIELMDHDIIVESQFIPYFDQFIDKYMKTSDSIFDSFQFKI